MKTDPAARFRVIVERAWWTSLDLIFPPRCSGCRRVGERLCSRCCTQIEYISGTVCERCGYPQDAPRTGDCDQCRRVLFPGGGLRSLAFHAGPLRQAIHALKYRHNPPLSEVLAGLMAARWPGCLPDDAILMPVPLSAERMHERGFNQAELLARHLGVQRHRPAVTDALQRTRATRSQVGLGATERRENVAGAFSADPEKVRGASVVVVDDVCTTGATLRACAEALLQSGASQVWAYTLARARREGAGNFTFDGGS